jgi:type IV pilus assembly protein PilN
MAKINLLPWREERRKQLNTEFGIFAGIIAAVAVGLVMAANFYYDQLIDNANARNQFMQTEINKLEKKLQEINKIRKEKERLLARIETIQKLESNRTEIVHLFDEIVRGVPDGVYLNSMRQSGDNLTLDGIAESNTRVSELVKNIDKSAWFDSPRIDIIQRRPNDVLQSNKFTVRMKQARPKTGGEEEGEG